MDDIIQRIVKSLNFDSRTGRRNNSKQRNTVNESERGLIMSKPHDMFYGVTVEASAEGTI